jgi:hypothetical protein
MRSGYLLRKRGSQVQRAGGTRAQGSIVGRVLFDVRAAPSLMTSQKFSLMIFWGFMHSNRSSCFPWPPSDSPSYNGPRIGAQAEIQVTLTGCAFPQPSILPGCFAQLPAYLVIDLHGQHDMLVGRLGGTGAGCRPVLCLAGQGFSCFWLLTYPIGQLGGKESPGGTGMVGGMSPGWHSGELPRCVLRPRHALGRRPCLLSCCP